MAAIMPPLYTDPPPAGPVRYGLFTAARGPLELPPHARMGGIEFEPDTCGVAYAYTAACPATDQAEKTFDTAGSVQAEPYVIYASIVCAPTGRTPAEQSRRAVARLLAGEQTVAEAALWSGAGVGAAPTLTGAGATVVTSTLTGFAARIGALEAAFYAEHGYQGTIHVNSAAAETAAAAHTVEQNGAVKQTKLGSIWSFGAGYGTTGPAGAAADAGSVWAFITPPVTLWRATDINTPDPAMTLDRATNQMYALAEREYLHAWDCDTVFAIQVPLESGHGGDSDLPPGSVTPGVEETV